MISLLHTVLLQPRAGTDSGRRRESILNILLLGSLSLSTLLLLHLAIKSAAVDSNYQGVPLPIAVGIWLMFASLYLLSRLRFSNLAAYILVSLYYLVGTYTLYRWSFILPAGLLIYCLVIVMSGILIGTRFAFFITAVICVSVLGLASLEVRGITHPTMGWLFQPFQISDSFAFLFTFVIIVTVSWLSNREIERSLCRAIVSEKALKEERDLLEVKVEERTAELNEAQFERIMELTRFADFGRLASALLHDLVNPLTIVSLNLEQLASDQQPELLQRAIEATKRMEQFMEFARREIRNEQNLSLFQPDEEIRYSIKGLHHVAKRDKVSLETSLRTHGTTFGSATKLQQLVTHLLSNALESYRSLEKERPKRRILTSLSEEDGEFTLSVQDWASGIPSANLKRIFDPFFSTREGTSNTGIGLALCKEIVERDLGGTLSVVSTHGEGTTFTARFPKREG